MIENEIKERNPINEIKIKETEKIYRFPFHGKSKYLIDKLYIIGYDNETLNKSLIKNYNNIFKKEDFDDIDSPKARSSKIYSTKLSQTNSKELNNRNENENINSFSISESPSLLNEIINDYNKKVLDIDITINMIFPNKPILYSFKESKRQLSPDKRNAKNRRNTNFNTMKSNLGNIRNSNDEIKDIMDKKKYFVIFSSNPQIDKKNKKSINGFCYINYCKYKEKRIISDYTYSFYVPIGICFISEFPFYNSYYKLAEQIFLLFNSKKIEVPIEIMLYNLINCTLSPINGDIDLCIEPVSFFNNLLSPSSNSLSKKTEIENSIKKEYENKKNNEKEIRPFSLNDLFINIGEDDNSNNKKEEEEKKEEKKEENGSNSTKLLAHVEQKIEKKLDLRSSLKKTIVIKDENLDRLLKTKSLGGQKHQKQNLFESIKFPYLQGYSLCHYNLPKIFFNNISLSKLIFIFINTFLEKDILIFSENIELLSLIINSLHNLNYPLNDNTYYVINASVSYNNYINGNLNYISTAFNSIIGINSSFKLNYLNENKNKYKEHIIYDLDNKEIYIQNKNDNSFFQYIKKILKLKDDKEYKGSLLAYEIKRLHDSLNITREKYTNLLLTLNQTDNNIFYRKNFNLEIQEAFYRFIVNILVYYYRQLIFQMDFDNNSQNNNNNNDNNNKIIDFNKNYEFESNIKYKNTEEEKYFFNEFKNTFKYDIFFNNYINNHESLDLYNISYIFLEEFISIISRAYNPNMNNNYLINFFKIFENLYNKKQSQKTNIDFNTFLSEYFKKYKSFFERDIIDFNKDGKQIIKLTEKKTLNYQWYELDNRLLLNYILLTKSLNTDEYERMFNLNSILNENIPKRIKISDIEDEIEKEIFENNNYYNNGLLINDDDICCMNIIILINLTLKNIDIENYMVIFIGSLFKDFFLFRKYYHMLMDMIYRVIQFELKENKPKNVERINNLLSFYYPCINSFREKNIIPNEKIIKIISNMNKIDTDIRNHKINNENIYYEDLKEDKNKIDKNNYIIFVYHNFSYFGILKEKNIIEYINREDKDDENNWKNRLGFIIGLRNEEKKILIVPKIKYISKYTNKENVEYNLSVESEVYSQRKIKFMLNEEYQKFINSNLDDKVIDKRNIINCLLNIIIYIRNSKKYEEKYEIEEAFKIILYHHMSSLVK